MKKLIIIFIILSTVGILSAADTYYGTSDTTGSGINYGTLVGYQRALMITSTEEITADSIYILIRKYGLGSSYIMVAIMRSADSSRVDVSDSVEITDANEKIWIAIPMNGETLKADSSYFLGAAGDAEVDAFRLTSGGSKTTLYRSGAWDGAWDDPETGWTTTTSAELWIYVAGTASGGEEETSGRRRRLLGGNR